MSSMPLSEEQDEQAIFQSPKWDPEADARAVFRETFLRELGEAEPIAAFRAFAKHLALLPLADARHWSGTPAEATAEELQAVAAD